MDQVEALTETEAARRLGVSISGLRKWRHDGNGPRFVHIGRLVRYLVSDVQVWLEKCAVDPQLLSTKRERGPNA